MRGAWLLALMALSLVPGRPALAEPDALSLRQVLEIGLPASTDLELSRRQVARDQALVDLAAASRLPQLALIGSGSYTQVGTSIGLVTGLPTLGDLSLGLRQNGYALLQNSFATAGALLDVNLLPLRQNAELAASRSILTGSQAADREQRRQSRFDLISAYRMLQLHQALVPVWQTALEASTSLERDAEAIERRGLVARIDVLRARALRAQDAQGLAQATADLDSSRQQLAALMALPVERTPSASDPITDVVAWPLSLPETLEHALRDRPLLLSLQSQQRAQGQQARAARMTLLPSLSLVVGGGYSGNNLAVPVLNQAGSLSSGSGSVALTEVRQSAEASGSFYNWGVALLVRQPLYDGGRASSAATVAERQRAVLEADEARARRRIREDVSRAWSSLPATAAAVSAARTAVQAGERALHDAQLRYRALVEPLTEMLLVQRDLQVARASLLSALTRAALDRAVLERETGLEEERPASGEAPRPSAAASAP